MPRESIFSAYRLHTHFAVLRGKAVRIDATSASPKGDADERAVLQRTIEAYRCYILDRGSISDRLWNAINVVGSSSVCRSSDMTLATVTHVNDLTDADRAANVISDEIVDRAAPLLWASVLLRPQRCQYPGVLWHDRLHADPDRYGRDAEQGDGSDGLVRARRHAGIDAAPLRHELSEGAWAAPSRRGLLVQVNNLHLRGEHRARPDVRRPVLHLPCRTGLAGCPK